MTEKIFTVLDLIDLELKEHNALNLRCLGGRKGLNREISVPELNRPGLALSGFFDFFSYNRLQVFGRGEAAYIQKLEKENNFETIRQMFDYSIPCCVFTHNLSPCTAFFEIAEKARCPILQTELNTMEFTIRIIRFLSERFSPQILIHGVLVEVYGVGVLILGDSGIGKSEIALELVKHGHRLVTDDSVKMYIVDGNVLMGKGENEKVGHHMEIRGLGIINITRLFGVGAIRDRKRIQLVVALEEGNSNKTYDRIGLDEKSQEFLGISIHKLEIPVKPGRNIPVIIEAAAMNERLKQMGYHSAKEFNQNIMNWMERETARSAYFGSEDII
ncbi:MAG: HPr(Ser) kinase/phosphatase [Treponema sp.]|jgi:HPr kinase/phosphorylase|nr:HPr(Ser) kinase/phosphatase [Treponema sp.]